MLTKKSVKQLRVPVWVLSLTILLSLLAFSGSATLDSGIKQVETEAKISSRSVTKREVSFKQHLRTQLTSDFLLCSCVASSSYASIHHQVLVIVKFDRTETRLIFFLKPELASQPVYTPRSANALTFTKG